jgi:hypothetical protein
LTLPMSEVPPITLDALSSIAEIATALPATVSIGDWRLLPLTAAVITAVPGPTAVTVKVLLDEPA